MAGASEAAQPPAPLELVRVFDDEEREAAWHGSGFASPSDIGFGR